MAKIFGGRKEGYRGKEGLPKGEGGGGETRMDSHSDRKPSTQTVVLAGPTQH